MAMNIFKLPKNYIEQFNNFINYIFFACIFYFIFSIFMIITNLVPFLNSVFNILKTPYGITQYILIGLIILGLLHFGLRPAVEVIDNARVRALIISFLPFIIYAIFLIEFMYLQQSVYFETSSIPIRIISFILLIVIFICSLLYCHFHKCNTYSIGQNLTIVYMVGVIFIIFSILEIFFYIYSFFHIKKTWIILIFFALPTLIAAAAPLYIYKTYFFRIRQIVNNLLTNPVYLEEIVRNGSTLSKWLQDQLLGKKTGTEG